jgi:hypothetical protein
MLPPSVPHVTVGNTGRVKKGLTTLPKDYNQGVKPKAILPKFTGAPKLSKAEKWATDFYRTEKRLQVEDEHQEALMRQSGSVAPPTLTAVRKVFVTNMPNVGQTQTAGINAPVVRAPAHYPDFPRPAANRRGGGGGGGGSGGGGGGGNLRFASPFNWSGGTPSVAENGRRSTLGRAWDFGSAWINRSGGRFGQGLTVLPRSSSNATDVITQNPQSGHIVITDTGNVNRAAENITSPTTAQPPSQEPVPEPVPQIRVPPVAPMLEYAAPHMPPVIAPYDLSTPPVRVDQSASHYARTQLAPSRQQRPRRVQPPPEVAVPVDQIQQPSAVANGEIIRARRPTPPGRRRSPPPYPPIHPSVAAPGEIVRARRPTRTLPRDRYSPYARTRAIDDAQRLYDVNVQPQQLPVSPPPSPNAMENQLQTANRALETPSMVVDQRIGNGGGNMQGVLDPLLRKRKGGTLMSGKAKKRKLNAPAVTRLPPPTTAVTRLPLPTTGPSANAPLSPPVSPRGDRKGKGKARATTTSPISVSPVDMEVELPLSPIGSSRPRRVVVRGGTSPTSPNLPSPRASNRNMTPVVDLPVTNLARTRAAQAAEARLQASRSRGGRRRGDVIPPLSNVVTEPVASRTRAKTKANAPVSSRTRSKKK